VEAVEYVVVGNGVSLFVTLFVVESSAEWVMLLVVLGVVL